ncbi:MAG: hypothetical protein WD768_14160 [Phycisphaeraceae bacterium]
MAKKPAKRHPLVGLWYIVSMSAWDDEYLNEEVQAHFRFDDAGLGSFQFGYVQGQIDYRTLVRDGKPAVEFSWEGGDGADGTPLTGRGWAKLEGDELNGMIHIHQGDDSEFVAKRCKARIGIKQSPSPDE